jgi:uncharacterized membrane protein YqjE
MPKKSQQTFIKITDWILTGVTLLLTGYISFQFIMLIAMVIIVISETFRMGGEMKIEQELMI